MSETVLPSLDAASRGRAERMLLWDGVFARLMDTLTGGVFLAGLGLYLGADNFTIGLIASLPFFAQAAQLPTVKLLLRATDRRRIVVACTALARVLLILLALLVLWRGAALGPVPLAIVMGLLAVLAVVASAAWNWWVRDVILRDQLGRYFSRRMRATTLVAAATLVGAGFLLDGFVGRDRAAQGYAILFAVGGLCGLVSTGFLMATPHVAPRTPPRREGVMRLFWATMRDRHNRRLVAALGLVSATMAAALPFTAVYLLRSIEYSYVWVTGLALASQLSYVGGLRGWGYLSDRFGDRPTLLISLGILVAALFGWSVAWSEGGNALLAFLLVLHLVSGFAIGGAELSYGNILLKNAPEDGAPAYLAAMGVTRAFVGGIATLAAGAVWHAIGSGVILTLHPWDGAQWALRGFHVLALASALIGVAGMVALSRVRTPGETAVADVAVAMRREVRMMSSVAGIRAFVHVVSYVVEYLTRDDRPGRRPPSRASEPGPAPGPAP